MENVVDRVARQLAEDGAERSEDELLALALKLAEAAVNEGELSDEELATVAGGLTARHEVMEAGLAAVAREAVSRYTGRPLRGTDLASYSIWPSG